MATLFMGGSSAVAQGLDYTSDSLEQVNSSVQTKQAYLVDVRERREWDRGHLQRATLLPLSRLSAWETNGISAAEREALLKAMPPGSVVYCHCAFGGRALTGGEVLRRLGYDARPLRQGYQDLVNAGFTRAER